MFNLISRRFSSLIKKKYLFISILVMFVLITGICILVLMINSENRMKKSDTPFLVLDRTNIKSVNIKNKEGNFYIERSADGNYKVVEFKGLQNHQSMINAYLGTIADIWSYQTISNLGKLGDYGLSDPACVTDIILTSGTQYHVAIGKKTPDGKGYYAKRNDDSAVYIIYAENGDSLTQSVYLLLVTQFLPEVESTQVGDLEKILFTGYKREVPIEIDQIYNENGTPTEKFRMVSPYTYDADDEAMRNIILEVTGVMRGSVEKLFPDQEDLKKYKLDKPDYVVTLTIGGVVFTANVGGTAPDNTYYVKRNDVDIVFRVPEERLKWFYLQAEELITSSILSRDIMQVDSLFVKTKDKQYDIQIGENGGSVNGNKLTDDKIRELYTSMAIITKDGILLDAKPGNENLLEITYRYKNGQSDRVEYRIIDDNRTLCMINSKGIFYVYTYNVQKIIDLLKSL
jgi:hypothetical protein